MNRNFAHSLLFAILLFSPCKQLWHESQTKSQEKIDSNSDKLPSIDEDKTNKDTNTLNTAVNRFFNAKQIQLNKLNLSINLNTLVPSDVLNLNLENLDIDLGNINTLSINFYSHLKIEYKGFSSEFDIEYKADDSLYISSKKGNTIKCSLPLTLNDLFSTLKAIGININSSVENKNVSLLSIINLLQSYQAKAVENISSDSTLIYSISFDDTDIADYNLSNLKLLLLADKDENPIGFKTESPINILSNKNDNKAISISIDSTIKKVYEVSRYTSHSFNDTDITDQNSSIFKLVNDIFSGKYSSSTESKKQFNVDIQASMTKKVNSSLSSTSYITGLLQSDITNVFDDENMGEYTLSLTQNESGFSSGTCLNDFSIYFKKESTYLSLNNTFKGKIENSQLKDTFSTISELTKLFTIKEIDKDLNFIFSLTKEGNIEKLRNGDYSILNNFVKNYQFSSSYFSITLDTSSFDIGNDDITITMNFNNVKDDEYEVKNIIIDKIDIKDVTINDLTLSVNQFTNIAVPDDNDYPNYTKSLSLFDTLSNIVNKKKIAADYSLIFTDQQNITFNAEGKISLDISNATMKEDETTRTLYTDTGNYYLSLNLPQDKNDKDTILGQGIEMYYSGADKNLYFGYQYDQNENFSELKDSSYYVFKNSIADTDIKSMYSLLNSKVDNNASSSSSILTMSTLLSTIAESDAFKKLKEDINNNLSLKGLDGIISSTVDENNNIQITLDPSQFISNSKYETNTTAFTLTIGNDNDIVSLSMSGKANGCGISFSLALNDKIENYSKFNTTDYPIINDAEIILDSFVSLPTGLKEFDLGIEGKIINDNDSVPSLEIENTSGISANLNSDKPSISGLIELKHKDINDNTKLISSSQKLEFSYQSMDGETKNTANISVPKRQYILEYNDNMHVKMENSNLYDIMNTINSVDSDSNLLFRYLKFLNSAVQSSGSPLMDVINGKALSTTGIFASPYFKELNFKEGYIELKIDPKIIQSDALDNSLAIINIYYDSTNKKITSASINAKYITSSSAKNIDLTLSLKSTSEKEYARNETTDTSKTAENNNILSYVDGTTSTSFVDVDGLKILLQCTIDTTENNFMEIQGELSIDISIVSKTITASAYAAIYIENETAYAYIRINAFNHSINDDGYRVSEFFIKEKEVYVNQTTTTVNSKFSWGTKYSYSVNAKYYKTTSENIVNNIAYYILDFSMNLSSVKVLFVEAGTIALNQIYDAINSESSSSSISNDFSKVLSSGQIYDATNNSFKLSLNLKDFLSISPASVESLTLTITHENESTVNGKSYKPLKSVAIDGKLSVLSILNITIKSSSTLNTFSLTKLEKINASQASSTYMQRYYNFMNLISNETFDLYEITSISEASKPNYTGSYKESKLESAYASSSSFPFTDEQITANGYIYKW